MWRAFPVANVGPCRPTSFSGTVKPGTLHSIRLGLDKGWVDLLKAAAASVDHERGFSRSVTRSIGWR
jgi:hypothetical protein